ncbi:DinB family protein [Pseudopedobacter sp.]|uniref:DinB family protein n=1 Tax=Pseudopedobacter sp. TaxID=1936787 RepID=UPI00334082D1
MGIKQNYLAELEREIASTKKLIACIPNDKWDWKPHEKSASVGELAKHITELTGWTVNIAEKDKLDFRKDYIPLSVTTKEDLLNLLDIYAKECKEALEKFDDAKWGDKWSLTAGEHIIAELPKFAAKRFIVNNHIYHHRGQLSVYLRLLDVPIPGMYGPSADENAKTF